MSGSPSSNSVYAVYADDSGRDNDWVHWLENTQHESLLQPLTFDLLPFVDRRSRALGVHERHFQTVLRRTGHMPERANLWVELRSALRRAIDKVLQGEEIHDRDRVFFNIHSDRLTNSYHGYPMRVGEWRAGEARVDDTLNHLAKMLNSNEQFELDDTFQLSITHVLDAPRGSRPQYRRPGQRNQAAFRALKGSIVTIKNKDEMCCARALVTARARLENRKWQSFKRGCKIQKVEAQDLHFEAGVPFGPCSYEEINRFALAPSLVDYQVLLVDATRQYKVSTFGPPRDKQLILYYTEGHYDVITSLPGFFGTSFVCAYCHAPYDHVERHRCKASNTCSCCFQRNCQDFVDKVKRGERATLTCPDCLRQFFGDLCLEAHRTKGSTGKSADGMEEKSICDIRKRCRECLFTKRSPRDFQRHQCGHADCPSCGNYVDIASHRCFIQKAPPEEELKKTRFKYKRKRRGDKNGPPSKRGAAAERQALQANASDIEEEEDGKDQSRPVHVYFDIEAMQTDGRHVANLLMAELEDDEAETELFAGETCIEKFLDWLDDLSEYGQRPVTVLAHNFKGYDGYFILQEYHNQNRQVKQVRNGAKILQLTTGSIRFIDSFSFCPFALARFPSTFGLAEQKKGYFPHLFNKRENQDYVGNLPAEDYYIPESMSLEEREKFKQWYDERQAENYQFTFKKELVEYCTSDVKLLKAGCQQFKSLFTKMTGFNPFNFITIASACNRDFRMNRMQENQLASEPLHGWRPQQNHSRVGCEWLHWCNHQRVQAINNAGSIEECEQLNLADNAHSHDERPPQMKPIQHAKNKGEYRIPESRYTVDGFDPSSNTVYEFQGCFWHGCLRCFKHRDTRHPRHLGLTMQEVYNSTRKKIQFLEEERGYNVVEMWECDWARLKDEDENVRAFCQGLDFMDPLNPRDAFFGGRTNAIKMYHRADIGEGEEIRYVDVTSLYPFVNKYKRYPVGHPQFFSQVDPATLSNYFGLVKCCLVPPRKLYYPVLPIRQQQKLLFPLCTKCAALATENPLMHRPWTCPHDDDERAFVGTWCTPEVEKAVKMGYRVIRVYEVWHFPETSDSLFKEYINVWLRVKQEAEGWPKDLEDDPVKQAQYIEDYFRHEKIRLRPDHIKKNPGLRSLAKLMLNCFWGKFGQQSNKSQVHEFVDPEEFHKFLDSDLRDIRYIGVVNENTVEVHSRYIAENCPVQPHLNIFVACFTTCWARLHLYESLQLLGEQVLYFDTDSIIYKWRPGLPEIPTGNYLGEMKDELNGDVIVEFVAAGPKNYGYVTKDGKVVCKVRGFCLNSEGSAQLNFEVMRKNVLDEVKDPKSKPREITVVQSNHIVRNATTYELCTYPQYKRYRVVFNKRALDPITFQSYPYGYEERKDEDDDN